MRTIAFCVSPVSAAINRVLQCVLLAGIVSKVFVITSSTCASVMLRGAPGRGLSNNPSSRCRRKPLAPFAHRGSRNPESFGDDAIWSAIAAPEYDASANRHSLRGLPATRQGGEFLDFFLG